MKQINTFDKVNTNFVVLSEQDLLDVEGGEWPGEGLVRAIFDIGKETGRALRKLF